MMVEMLVPPKLAAALFRVAATIPGATVVPHAADAAGRPGIAVARNVSEDKADAELIFNQHTYQFLGAREVLTSPVKGEGPAGTVIEAYAQLKVHCRRSPADQCPHRAGDHGLGQFTWPPSSSGVRVATHST